MKIEKFVDGQKVVVVDDNWTQKSTRKDSKGQDIEIWENPDGTKTHTITNPPSDKAPAERYNTFCDRILDNLKARGRLV